MKTIKEQVGGRPLSAVTPEKKLMDPSSRPVVDGKAQQLWVASVSPEATMSCIVEVGRASSLMRMAGTQLTHSVVARASPHMILVRLFNQTDQRKICKLPPRANARKQAAKLRDPRAPRSGHDEQPISGIAAAVCLPLLSGLLQQCSTTHICIIPIMRFIVFVFYLFFSE